MAPPRMMSRVPRARFGAVFTAVLLLAAGVVTARELWYVEYENHQTDSWVTPAVSTLSNFHFEPWMYVLVLGLALIAVWLLILAIQPAPRGYVPMHTAAEATVSADNAWWLSPIDVARLCSAAALKVPGVETAHSVVNRSFTKLQTTYSGEAFLQEQVEEAVSAVASQLSLAKQPRVRVIHREPQATVTTKETP